MARLAQVFASQDREFFDLFEEAARTSSSAADLLDQMLGSYPDRARAGPRHRVCEQEGDRITHEIIQR